MLYFISIGLNSERDMSLKALEVAKKCDILLWENYTTRLDTTVEKLSKLIGKEVKEAGRSDIEDRMSEIVEQAKLKNVGILVGGDALTATTHISLILEAKKQNVPVKVIHGSSILTAVAETGLQIYKFGRIVTLPASGFTNSIIDMIKMNLANGLHSLILLDIDLSPLAAVKMLRENLNKLGLNKEAKIIAACKLGSDEAVIKYGSIESLANDNDIDKVPGVLIIPGDLHFMEEEVLKLYEIQT